MIYKHLKQNPSFKEVITAIRQLDYKEPEISILKKGLVISFRREVDFEMVYTSVSCNFDNIAEKINKVIDEEEVYQEKKFKIEKEKTKKSIEVMNNRLLIFNTKGASK